MKIIESNGSKTLYGKFLERNISVTNDAHKFCLFIPLNLCLSGQVLFNLLSAVQSGDTENGN